METVMKELSELVRAQLQKRKPAITMEDAEIFKVLEIANANGISNIVCRSLLMLDLSKEMQSACRNILLRSFINHVRQNNEAAILREKLTENHIRFQFLKGMVLQDYYPEVDMREMGDIDILIDQENAEAVHDMIEKLGYVLEAKECYHDVYSKDGTIILEVHVELYNKKVDRKQYEYFGSFIRSIPKADNEYEYEFTKEDFYIYMMAHLAKHFSVMGCGIRHLIDNYVYRSKNEQEWNLGYIQSGTKKCGIDTFTKHIEALSTDWIEHKGDLSGLNKNLFEYMLDCGIYGKDQFGIWNEFSKLKKNEKELSKKELRMWYFFPPLSYMKYYHKWLNRYPWLLPIAWGSRCVSGLIKHKGKYKREMIKNIDVQKISKIDNIYKEMRLDFHN